jgi:uncharacterized repeat protein (TIGR03803 family)
MFRILYIAAKCILICGLALAMFVPLDGASARGSETVLYSFTGGNDGAYPYARLLADNAGNLYGTTESGGGATDCEEEGGCGTVFKLAPDGTETVLYSFCNQTNCADGANPDAGLIADAQGNFYGTTYDGGSGSDCQAYSSSCGTVFKLAPDGTETVLYSFKGGNDGSEPVAGLIIEKKGNLYGTTLNGGAQGVGTIFELASDGTETVLHTFTGAPDGANPAGGLIEIVRAIFTA